MVRSTQSGLGKQGEKFVNRNDGLKILLTDSERKVFELKSKKISEYFLDNGYLFNEQQYFRILMLNFDNIDLQNKILSLYSQDVNPIFKVSK